MSQLYAAEEIRAWDQFTIENEPISSLDLMERAAIGSCKKIIGSYPFRSISIVCGKGNNGGDGLAIARLLSTGNVDVNVFICEITEGASADFATNLKRLPPAVNVKHLAKGDEFILSDDLIVDCIFGSGLNRPIENWLTVIIEKMNAHPSPIVAIDIPSGLYVGDNAENTLKTVITANSTLSFQIPKLPFFFRLYEKYIGDFSIINIGLLAGFEGQSIGTFVDSKEIKLKPISNFAFKGDKGYLTVIGGGGNMIGAALLCAQASFKSGAGYVGVIANEKIQIPLATTLPEAIWAGENPTTLPTKTTAIAVGIGLGQSGWSRNLLETAIESGKPLVVDADAINMLAADETLLKRLPKGSILTPHLGELHRLIGKAERPESLLKKQIDFSVRHGIYVIQKGAYSKLTTPEGKLYVNSTGNSAMASAGMGDALTGIIGAFLAQGYSPFEAAKNGMYFHGLAGDLAARKVGTRGMLTSDLIAGLPELLSQF